MSISIYYAVEDFLRALARIPLADITVRYYGFCYQAVLQYCAGNGLEHFSDEAALHFSLFSTKRQRMEKYAILTR